MLERKVFKIQGKKTFLTICEKANEKLYNNFKWPERQQDISLSANVSWMHRSPKVEAVVTKTMAAAASVLTVAAAPVAAKASAVAEISPRFVWVSGRRDRRRRRCWFLRFVLPIESGWLFCSSALKMALARTPSGYRGLASHWKVQRGSLLWRLIRKEPISSTQ